MGRSSGGLPDIVREFRVQGLFIVFTTEILFYLGFALLIPTLPLYLADFQAGTAQIGLVMGVFAVGLLLSRPYIGRFIDQYGARCSLRWGGGILMVSSVLYAFAPALAWVYPIRILHGVSMAFHSTASNAIISSSTTAENRGGIMGLFGISRAVAFGVGPFAGGIFLGWWGHAAVFGLAGALGLAAMTVARFSGDCSMVEAEEAGPRMLDLLKDRTLVFVTGAMFILTIVHGGLTTFLPLHVMRQMAGNLGTFYLVYSLTITVMEILAGKASDRECRVPVMLASVALLGAGLFAVGGVSGTLSLVFASVIYGAGFGGFQVAIGAFVGDQTDDHNRGKVFGLFYSSFDLGIAVSGVIMGSVAAGTGLAGMFYISSLVVIPAALLLLFAPRGGLRAALSCGWLGDFRPRFRHLGGDL